MNKPPGIPPEPWGRILHLFKSCPAVSEAILFGSRAKGNFREGSDIDIALKGNPTLEDIQRLLNAYDNLFLPWKLDLVVWHDIRNKALREHIQRVGIGIYKS